MKKLRVLVVENDPFVQDQLSRALEGHAVDVVDSLEGAKEALSSRKPDICFIDLDLEGSGRLSGLKVIQPAHKQGVYAVVLTNHDELEIREMALQLGCDEFHIKREGLRAVSAIVTRFLTGREFVTEAMYQFARDRGLNALLDGITDTIIRRNLADSNDVQRAVCRNLGISNAILYAYFRRMNAQAEAQRPNAPTARRRGGRPDRKLEDRP